MNGADLVSVVGLEGSGALPEFALPHFVPKILLHSGAKCTRQTLNPEPGRRCRTGGKRHTPGVWSEARDALLRSSPAPCQFHWIQFESI